MLFCSSLRPHWLGIQSFYLSDKNAADAVAIEPRPTQSKRGPAHFASRISRLKQIKISNTSVSIVISKYSVFLLVVFLKNWQQGTIALNGVLALNMRQSIV